MWRRASFELETTGRAAVVHAHGDVDVDSAPAMAAVLDEAVATGRDLVVVDLEDVTFLDSAALSAVFRTQRELPPDRRLLLGNVPQRMLRVLRIASVAAVIDVHRQGDPQPWAG